MRLLRTVQRDTLGAMVRGFHVIFTTYGFWLPNDQRGSGSDFVRCAALTKFGPPNPVATRQSVAHRPFEPEIRKAAQASLRYPPVRFNGVQARCVGLGFERELSQYGGTIYACAILPDHVHLVLGPHRYDIRRFVARLRGAATKTLREDGLHPLAEFVQEDGSLPSPWSRLPWIVYLWKDRDVLRSIQYIENNPLKSGFPKQKWAFVRSYLPSA